MTNNQTAYWLATLYLPTLKPADFLKWCTLTGGIDQFFTADSDTYHALGVSLRLKAQLANLNWHGVEQDLKWAEQPGQHIVTFGHPGYPASLKEIAQPPLVLFVQGSLALLQRPQLAIIGSRQASVVGKENADRFAHYLSREGWVITSGMALGIDTAAHLGALRAEGETIGVAGTGLNHCYPASNKVLMHRIIQQGGAILSEFPLSTPPHAFNFPRRNRIISGLSKGVVVIEAALRSGSLSTVRHALDQGKEVFALPGSIHHPQSRGCHYLIRQGAKLVETVSDIVEELPGLGTSKKRRNEPLVQKTTDQNHLFLANIGYEITPTDVIISRSGLTPGEVSSILLMLELQGLIQSVAGGYIRCAP